jgi:hypothetical protein
VSVEKSVFLLFIVVWWTNPQNESPRITQLTRSLVPEIPGPGSGW